MSADENDIVISESAIQDVSGGKPLPSFMESLILLTSDVGWLASECRGEEFDGIPASEEFVQRTLGDLLIDTIRTARGLGLAVQDCLAEAAKWGRIRHTGEAE